MKFDIFVWDEGATEETRFHLHRSYKYEEQLDLQ
jgi:hypothetical protein